jgi:histidinol phosphatase-like PHP family hydrolase/calcineurin-like phosphoesterase family protein
LSSKVKIAVITDIHFGDNISIAERQGKIGDVLLLRTVHRLNRLIHPDITLVLGDVLDDPDASDAAERLALMREILDLLESPWMVIPGNHDPEPKAFYEVLPEPPDYMDVNGTRFVPFIDPEEPGWNSRRTADNLEKTKRARHGHDGPIVAFQHVSLFPEGSSGSPFNYTNLAEVMESLRENGVTLSIGGHFHAGTDLIREGAQAFVVGRALCESPFSFMEIDLDDEDIQVTHHAHQMPPELELFDYHSHTQFAYCSENMDMAKSPELADKLGLRGITFTEHSGQLYYDSQTYWSGELCKEGIRGRRGFQNRMPDYWDAAGKASRENLKVGLEVDSDFQGNMILADEDRQKAKVLNGAVHKLQELKREDKDINRAADEFLSILENFIPSGIQILAHPFRIFRGHEVPARLFDPVVKLLKENGVAAEMNFHYNRPQPEFVLKCIEAGVGITFGTDAHNLYEVGEFAPHLQFLKEIGFDGDLNDILAVI